MVEFLVISFFNIASCLVTYFVVCDFPKARATVRQCYTSILDDLKEAEVLPVKHSSLGTVAMYYGNYLSAKALKAKVYLLSMGNFDEAYKLAL